MPQKHDIGHAKRAKNAAALELEAARKAAKGDARRPKRRQPDPIREAVLEMARDGAAQ